VSQSFCLSFLSHPRLNRCRAGEVSLQSYAHGNAEKNGGRFPHVKRPPCSSQALSHGSRQGLLSPFIVQVSYIQRPPGSQISGSLPGRNRDYIGDINQDKKRDFTFTFQFPVPFCCHSLERAISKKANLSNLSIRSTESSGHGPSHQNGPFGHQQACLSCR
jgi:hypothetical protein